MTAFLCVAAALLTRCRVSTAVRTRALRSRMARLTAQTPLANVAPTRKCCLLSSLFVFIPSRRCMYVGDTDAWCEAFSRSEEQ